MANLLATEVAFCYHGINQKVHAGGFAMYNKHLDAFLMAADCGSFTKAAEKL